MGIIVTTKLKLALESFCKKFDLQYMIADGRIVLSPRAP